MMDWHYHKDDRQTKEETEWYKNVQAWQKAGFVHIWVEGKSIIECPHCAALVTDKNWLKHLKSLHAHLIITNRFMKQKIDQNLFGKNNI